MPALTVTIPAELEAGLRELATKRGVPVETVALIALRRFLANPA